MSRMLPVRSPRLVLALLLVCPSLLPAQEMGAVRVRATSANAELPSAHGYGAGVSFDLPVLRVGLEYVRYADATDKRGTVCTVYSPRIGCRQEDVSTRARMGGLRLTVLPEVDVAGVAQLRVGGGLSFNQLSAHSVGDSGARADLHMPNSGQIGYLGVAEVALRPVASIPLRIRVGVRGHWVDFKGCVDPADPTSGYAPFCGVDRFTEIHAGFSVSLPSQGGP